MWLHLTGVSGDSVLVNMANIVSISTLAGKTYLWSVNSDQDTMIVRESLEYIESRLGIVR